MRKVWRESQRPPQGGSTLLLSLPLQVVFMILFKQTKWLTDNQWKWRRVVLLWEKKEGKSKIVVSRAEFNND